MPPSPLTRIRRARAALLPRAVDKLCQAYRSKHSSNPKGRGHEDRNVQAIYDFSRQAQSIEELRSLLLDGERLADLVEAQWAFDVAIRQCREREVDAAGIGDTDLQAARDVLAWWHHRWFCLDPKRTDHAGQYLPPASTHP
ncbi:MAG: hypothetical protein AAF333_13230 [Planctomycetota bacterium]